MKIGPLTERWNDGEQDWSFVKDPTTDIEKWEQATGYKLPADYRNFMIRFNGGSIFPRHFHTRLVIGPAGPYHNESDVTFVDPILSWKSVESHWRGEMYGKGVPPKHLVFATTPGSIELLMSLEASNHGKIFAWYHTRTPWGEDGNNRIDPVAENFTAFLKSLFSEGDDDFESWRNPVFDRIAKDFEP
jgi:hypothetical protein